MNLITIEKNFNELPYEFVERKGKGHPDSLSDNLAEYLSGKYSQYTLEKFGVILHHNFDKVGLLGGASDVSFGYGKITNPIRVLINGRASSKYGDENIDLKNLLIKWATEFLTENLPIKNAKMELDFHYNLSTQSSPGKTDEDENIEKSARNFWFEPRGPQDIPELTRLASNDTSMGVGFFPYTALEDLVLEIENDLNSDDFKEKHPWVGSDIKIMGFRLYDDYKITMCIPQISEYVASLDEYIKNIEFCDIYVRKIAEDKGINNFELHINTRDNYEKVELYLTATGSSIESGDEGLVGRGNRIQGVISPTRLMSMEGAAGKNPVYHIGKLYYLCAQKISERIYEEFSLTNETVLVSQSGRDLLDPWIVFVHLPASSSISKEKLEKVIMEEVNKIPEITKQVINLELKIC